MRLFIIVAAAVAADQLSKYLVATRMEVGQSLPLIKNFLAITYVRNPGAAFGVLAYQTIFLVIVSLVVIGLIIYFYRVVPVGFTFLRVGMALQLGGALGNLIDRVRHHSVVDFIDLKFFPPVFNLADMFIVTGVVIFLVAFWRAAPVLESSRR